MAELNINGQWESYCDPVYVHTILTHHKLNDAGIAIAINGTVYPRSQWETPISSGSQVDIVTAVQGG